MDEIFDQGCQGRLDFNGYKKMKRMIKLEFEQNLSRDDVIIISRDGRKWFVISGSSRLMEERHLNPMPSEDKKPFGMILESAALS